MTESAVSLRTLLEEHTMPAAEALTRREDGDALRCLACGHRCLVRKGRHGACFVRFHRDGMLRVPTGYVSALAVDPIEKKPFYHVLPGAGALSFGMLGCNFHCPFCQNWMTSQTLRDERAVVRPRFVSARRIVELAVEHHCPVITSTYNEPLITSEWAVQIFRLGRDHGLLGAYVSNGNATPEVLEYIRPWVDVCNVDLKAFCEKTYRALGGRLESVLDTIRRLHQMNFWIEVVTLVVPGLNDSDDELARMAAFLAGVSPDIPWHVTAFHPDYKMNDRGRTPAATLRRAWDIGRREGLRYVYAGNLPGMVEHCENTCCPGCGRELIVRHGFSVRENHLKGACCPDCGERIAGIWQPRGSQQAPA